ncbi:MAG TPA: hypothetical protein VNZ94_00295 [Xanthobacteraceae bacterium]|nr:hypothetical protein [Xanthobacteraceae bacterium]
MASRIATIVSLAIAFLSLALSVVLAVVAINGARDPAAQGDLGFFMVLVVVTPGTPVTLTLSGLLRLLMRDRTYLKLFLVLCALTIAVLCWDWLWLRLVWKA